MSTLYEYLNFLNDSNPGPGVIDPMAYRTQPVQQIDDRATGEMGIRVCVNRVYVFAFFLMNSFTILTPNFLSCILMFIECDMTKINRIISTQPGKMKKKSGTVVLSFHSK